jgi:hypothetical protein
MPAWNLFIHTNIVRNSICPRQKNYKVKNNEFRDLLGRLRISEPIRKDAEKLSNLHLIYYDEGFKSYLENNDKTMWLFAKNADKDLKN